jgi:hypothetical protein
MRGRELLFPGNPEKHARLLTMAELLENASKIKATLVPTTPSVFYTTQWQKYVKWTHINGISNENMYTEVVLLVYFDHLSKAGLRTIALTELRWDDVESVESGLRVIVRHSKTDQEDMDFIL